MTATQLEPGTSLLSEPHHDGSDDYVLERPDELGGEAVVRVRAPKGAADDVILRYVRDGEPRWVRAQVDRETETETWWRASFPVVNPSTPYRWVLVGPQGGWTWLNGNGRRAHESPDSDDFVLSIGDGPAWHLSSVVYEIFPDRFATSGLGVDAPDWAVPRAWNELPTGRGPNTPREWFGGDLRGIEQRLDYIEQLGVNALYLTPIFPASSTHRYDATSFDRVDPLLGGDDALRSLLAAAHSRGVRVLGDLTTNHTGNAHEWFVDALADPDALERELYYFDPSLPAGYESWLGIPSLPKLDWRSAELRRRMVGVTRRWLEAGLDGWRIDVANMTGRYRGIELTREVAQLIRGALTRGRAARRRARLRLPARPGRHRLARRDELRGLPAARLVVAAGRRPAGGAPPVLLGNSRWACPAPTARRPSARCARSGPVSRGSRRSTRGRSSTATTPHASAP